MARPRMIAIAAVATILTAVPVAAEAAPCPPPTEPERGTIFLRDTSSAPGDEDTNAETAFTADGRMTIGSGLRTPVATHRYEVNVAAPQSVGKVTISRTGGAALPLDDGEAILTPSAGDVALTASWQQTTRLPDFSFVPCERSANFVLPVAGATPATLAVSRSYTDRTIVVVDATVVSGFTTDLRPVTFRARTSGRLRTSGALRTVAILKFRLHGDQVLTLSRRRVVVPGGLFGFGRTDHGGGPLLEATYDGTGSLPRRGHFFVVPQRRTVFSRAGLKIQAVQGGKVIGTVTTGVECGSRVRGAGSGLNCRFVGYRVTK